MDPWRYMGAAFSTSLLERLSSSNISMFERQKSGVPEAYQGKGATLPCRAQCHALLVTTPFSDRNQ